MFLEMQEFDFVQIFITLLKFRLILPKFNQFYPPPTPNKKFARGCCCTPAPAALCASNIQILFAGERM